MKLKYALNPFTPFEPNYLCEYLEKQARKGWIAEKIGPTLIRYKKEAP